MLNASNTKQQVMAYMIEGLHCSYNKKDLVLSIPSLEIEAGKITVVLGKSGYGKSTLLETLGLMNNTFSEGRVYFSPPSLSSKTTYELRELWQKNDKTQLAHIRSEHFSFIFQHTNLMPNFTAFENIFLTRMIEGYDESDCRKETQAIIERIGLSGIHSDKKVTELAGGERQRLAFARAIISSFDVLFGDEPTGNLDVKNTYELMNVLSECIHHSNNDHPKTAVLVTHNIDMAIDYADTIMLITKDKGFGEIDEKNRFSKDIRGKKNIWTNKHISLSEEEYRSYLNQQFFAS